MKQPQPDPKNDMACVIDIAVFAYNEAANISNLIADVAKQTVFARPDVDIRLLILANGCTDDTVPVAIAARDKLDASLVRRIEVMNFERGGKSRTMHHFIHECSRRNADLLGFMDADIRLPETDTLERMIEQMLTRPSLQTFTSRPVKDIEYDSEGSSLISRVIAAGGGGLSDYRNAICGQLFMMRSAMMLTDLLSAPEDLERIDGDPEVYHIYESIRGIPELIRHQTRIVIGSVVNEVLYTKINQSTSTQEEAYTLLMSASTDANWLGRVLKESLPKFPYGYVPFPYLFWRLRAYPDSGKTGLKSRLMLFLGFGLDVVVYARASFHMMTRPSSGYW